MFSSVSSVAISGLQSWPRRVQSCDGSSLRAHCCVHCSDPRREVECFGCNKHSTILSHYTTQPYTVPYDTRPLHCSTQMLHDQCCVIIQGKSRVDSGKRVLLLLVVVQHVGNEPCQRGVMPVKQYWRYLLRH